MSPKVNFSQQASTHPQGSKQCKCCRYFPSTPLSPGYYLVHQPTTQFPNRPPINQTPASLASRLKTLELSSNSPFSPTSKTFSAYSANLVTAYGELWDLLGPVPPSWMRARRNGRAEILDIVSRGETVREGKVEMSRLDCSRVSKPTRVSRSSVFNPSGAPAYVSTAGIPQDYKQRAQCP
jgi:hypothetical protein